MEDDAYQLEHKDDTHEEREKENDGSCWLSQGQGRLRKMPPTSLCPQGVCQQLPFDQCFKIRK